MKHIKEIAFELYSESQKRYAHNNEPHSFYDGYREVDFNGKAIKYEASSMLMLGKWNVFFSKEEWNELWKELKRLITSKDNEWLETKRLSISFLSIRRYPSAKYWLFSKRISSITAKQSLNSSHQQSYFSGLEYPCSLPTTLY